jgi:hypothetical protein
MPGEGRRRPRKGAEIIALAYSYGFAFPNGSGLPIIPLWTR